MTYFVYHPPQRTGNASIILADYGYWANCIDELDEWCKTYQIERQGMTLEMDHDTLTLFLLKWS